MTQNKDITEYKKEEEKKEIIFDIEEDKNLLEEELKTDSLYFRLEENVTYKIRLTSTKIQRIEKTFEKNGEKETNNKYLISIIAKGSNKTEFEGLWEVGKSILNPIVKNYETGAIFNVSKSGTGTNTRYSVNKDF